MTVLAGLALAIVLSLLSTAIVAVLTGDWPEVASLIPGSRR